jgi:F-type H+-transporting ATPase subunit epsilon|tara:strand:- start:18 stop:251 length:234 start_codon:yes stop_codon:yes gene_type:complete
MKVEIISPNKLIFEGEANSLLLPGKDGSFGVLNDHAPIISSLTEGSVKLSTDEGEKSYEINGGVVEVLKNKVIILAD